MKMRDRRKTRKGRVGQKRPIISNTLPELRRLYGLTAKEVSKAAHIEYTYYLKIEAGESIPNVYTSLLLAQVFNVTPREIFINL